MKIDRNACVLREGRHRFFGDLDCHRRIVSLLGHGSIQNTVDTVAGELRGEALGRTRRRERYEVRYKFREVGVHVPISASFLVNGKRILLVGALYHGNDVGRAGASAGVG